MEKWKVVRTKYDLLETVLNKAVQHNYQVWQVITIPSETANESSELIVLCRSNAESNATIRPDLRLDRKGRINS